MYLEKRLLNKVSNCAYLPTYVQGTYLLFCHCLLLQALWLQENIRAQGREEISLPYFYFTTLKKNQTLTQ